MSAIFPLVHFHVHLFATNPHGQSFDVLSDPFPPYNAAIDFSYQFSKDSSPQDTSVTIHGLTREHAKKYFVKGSAITVYAGWANSDYSQNNYQCIFSSKITTVDPMINNGGDWQLSFTCTDGQKLGQSETALSKIYKSKSTRENASGLGELNSAEKQALNKIRKKFGIRANNIRDAKKALGPREKRLKDKLMSEYPTIHGRKRGSGETQHNSEMVKKRKTARNKITAEFTKLRNELSGKTHRNMKARQRATKSTRTRYQAKKKRKREQRAKNKSKSNKHKNGLHFKKGTRASTIIRSLARKAHLHINKIKLVHDKRYNSGYTADKKPAQCIQDIANDCDSAIWWPNGKLEIGDFSQHLPNDFVLTPETGLTETPDEQDDDDDSSNVPTYEVNAIFLPGVTTGTTFRIKDPAKSLLQPGKEPINAGSLFNDEVTVLSGSSSVNSGDTPTSDLTVVRTSNEKKSETMKVKSKNRRIKAKKDARSRRRTKAKRHARQSRRK